MRTPASTARSTASSTSPSWSSPSVMRTRTRWRRSVSANASRATATAWPRLVPCTEIMSGSIAFRKRAAAPVVARQRTLHERLARERDQPDPVAFEPADQVGDGEPGPVEPVRRDVLGRHRGRQVEGHHDVLPLAPHRLDPAAELRPGQRGDEQGHRRQHRRQLGGPAPPVDGGRQPVEEVALADEGEGPARARACPPREPREGRHQQVRQQHVGVGEPEHQGIFLSTVRARVISSTRSTRPAASGTWNSSP